MAATDKFNNEAAAKGSSSAGGRRRWLIALPLIVVLAMLGLFFVSLQSGDPQRLPSVLIGKPVPNFSLAALAKEDGTGPAFPAFGSTDLAKGKASLVNVWASWCAPCLIEHPVLMDLGRTSGVPIYGINYKDKPDAARRFLGRFGNPFTAIGVDDSGRTAIEFGVYGVPETFVVDGKGRIVLRHAGPLTPEIIEREIKPALQKAGMTFAAR